MKKVRQPEATPLIEVVLKVTFLEQPCTAQSIIVPNISFLFLMFFSVKESMVVGSTLLKPLFVR